MPRGGRERRPKSSAAIVISDAAWCVAGDSIIFARCLMVGHDGFSGLLCLNRGGRLSVAVSINIVSCRTCPGQKIWPRQI